MKEVLVSILKVEEDLKNKSLDAQNDADAINSTTKQKIVTLENDYENNFQKEKANSIEEIIKETKIYENKNDYCCYCNVFLSAGIYNKL